jgi:sugar fermentation stimulation protein A
LNFPSPLTHGRLVSRYKRFFADVILDDGTAVTAHCPNPGAMLGLKEPGLGVWLSRSDDPKRKLAHTLELVEVGNRLVGVNTLTPNRLVAEALAADAIPELTGYETIRREVKYGEASRIDFLLTHPERPACWLEVKNCHLSRVPPLAEFPDCVAARSAKHLRELSAMARTGDRAVVLFTVQREDCETFTACRDIDPVFSTALDEAADAGVEVLVYACEMLTESVRIGRSLPWRR